MVEIVVVPGTLGTCMIDARDRTIWPPGETHDAISSQEFVHLILDDGTRAGDVVRSTMCFNVYGTLLDRLAALPGARVTPCAYDWRLDVFQAADRLASVLRDLSGDEPIALVAHSQGGLVCRALLESDTHRSEPWFARIDRAVFIATPHLGAPLALFRMLGLSDVIPIYIPAWAVKELAAKPEKYPSPYQLVPPATVPCVLLSNMNRTDILTSFGALLDPAGVNAHQTLFGKLVQADLPPGIAYHAIYGTGQQTTSWMTVQPDGTPAPVSDDGDGTVPVWSAHPDAFDPQLQGKFTSSTAFPGDHIGMLADMAVTDHVASLILGSAPSAISGIGLSAASPVVLVGTPVHLLLFCRNMTGTVSGDIICRPIPDQGASSRFPVAGIPSNGRISIPLEMPPQPGIYSISFVGAGPTTTAPLRVVVVDAAARDLAGLAPPP